jgi:hypothetical protein
MWGVRSSRSTLGHYLLLCELGSPSLTASIAGQQHGQCISEKTHDDREAYRDMIAVAAIPWDERITLCQKQPLNFVLRLNENAALDTVIETLEPVQNLSIASISCDSQFFKTSALT